MIKLVKSRREQAYHGDGREQSTAGAGWSLMIKGRQVCWVEVCSLLASIVDYIVSSSSQVNHPSLIVTLCWLLA